ncbi:MAG: deoxyguanosinetriphosphate triphosphohydrolase, partial [Firmicutes bacterium]|nr:deoxyguanosinetriphosphate triphosphohydrolase [Bacillota bacterium]
LSTLFDYYGGHPGEMPVEFVRITETDGIGRGVCDFLASMTDSYIIDIFNELFVPKVFTVRS